MVSIKVLTHFLDKDQFGYLQYNIAIVGFVTMLLFGPLNSMFGRFWHKGDKQLLAVLFNGLIHLFVAGTLVLLTVCGFYFSGLQIPEIIPLGVTFFMLAMMYSFMSILDAIYLREKLIIKASWMQWLTSFVRLAILFPLFFITHLTPFTFWMVYAVGVTFSFWFLFFVAKKHLLVEPLFAKKVALSTFVISKNEFLNHRFVVYVLPFFIWGIFAAIRSFADRYFVQNQLGYDQLAEYTLIFQLTYYPISILQGITNSLFQPLMFSHYDEGEKRAFLQKLLFLISLLIIAILGLWGIYTLFGNEIILMISNDSYLALVSKLPMAAVALGLFFVGNTLGNVFLIVKKTKSLLFPNISYSVFLIALFVLYPWTDVEQLLYLILVANLYYLAIVLYFIKKRRVLL